MNYKNKYRSHIIHLNRGEIIKKIEHKHALDTTQIKVKKDNKCIMNVIT